MRCRVRSVSLLVLVSIFTSSSGVNATDGTETAIDFRKDIRPILSNACFRCHGPDAAERKGGTDGLRLDTSEGLISDLGGRAAVVPGQPDSSELIKRIRTENADEAMPPAGAGRRLTPHEIELIKKWIEQGAKVSAHWSYTKPVRPKLPSVSNDSWVRNSIDRFILARLDQEGLKPSPEADRYTLARRVSLDLTGLPPSIEEVNTFVNDTAPNAYESFVDRQLAKSAYGEHWGLLWLDLARYADSAGYADDPARVIWLYRDYVIRSLNANKPFDQFTVEQIAGDLLPNPTEEQLTATAFHRNTLTNNEGGTNDEEFRNVAVVDRVNTTMAVWMGTTMACAQCHSHKYDPITQEDYFRFFAFFNNTADADLRDEAPLLSIYTDEQKQQRTQLEKQIADVEPTLKVTTPELTQAENKWDAEFPRSVSWMPIRPNSIKTQSDVAATINNDGSIKVAAGAKSDVYSLDVPSSFSYRLLGWIDENRLKALELTADDVFKSLRNSQVPIVADRTEASMPAERPDFQVVIPSPTMATVELVSKSVIGKSANGTEVAFSDVGRLSLNKVPFRALRLEALPDDALPGKGPGHANGNFTVDRMTVQVNPPPNSALLGRFVRVELPGDKLLSLAEVQVFSGADNIAPGGDATQISTDYGGDAKRAIDGNTNGAYEANSTTHTAAGKDPWWEVDFKEERKIDRLAIWNRGDGVEDRLSNFRVLVLNQKRDVVYRAEVVVAPRPNVEFNLVGPRTIEIEKAIADYSQANYDPANVLQSRNTKTKPAWAIGGSTGKAHSLILVAKKPFEFPEGSTMTVTIDQAGSADNHTLAHFQLSATDEPRIEEWARTPSEVIAALQTPAAERTAEQKVAITQYYLTIAPDLEPLRQKVAAARKALSEIKPDTVPIMKELTEKRRVTRIQHRGNFEDLGGEVSEGTPSTFPSLPADAPRNRLTLAKWLIDVNNPLTGRVVANRYWEQLFGIGIVATSEEFGSQGDLPFHPELLDWLACELSGIPRDSDSPDQSTPQKPWDLKALVKSLVMSATYRQSSKVTPELEAKDSDNRLLARGPRFRLSAEALRDASLFVSGLLSSKMYGTPVRPPQPSLGLSAAFGSSTDWQTSQGEDKYRRGIYTTWRRSNPYPSMATFDAPNREVCTVRRVRTNTPLQALVTLNDPVYVEAAQALARHIVKEGGATIAERTQYAFRRVLSRPANEHEVARIVELHQQSLAKFKASPEDANKMATDPLGPIEGVDLADLASWTVVGNVLLNLDEFVMKR